MRKRLPALLAALAFVLLAPAALRADSDGWALYKSRFLTADGRVVDTGNGGVSHSEGQGWGLLFAEAHDDRAAFERILAWTTKHLAVRDDRLHAWRWLPDRPRDPTPDRNNATDGDIYIAWALLRGAERWQRPEWRAAALGILADLRACCIRRRDGLTLLLPGAQGFERDEGIVLNPSYWVFPAFQAFAEADGNPVWRDLATTGIALVAAAGFGPWQLPADWLLVGADGAAAPAPGFPPRFGYDAIRVPLYLTWAGYRMPSLFAPYARFLNAYGGKPPAWTDLSDGKLADYPADDGMRTVLELAAHAGNGRAARLGALVQPGLTDEQPYYAASLLLLSRLAARETPP